MHYDWISLWLDWICINAIHTTKHARWIHYVIIGDHMIAQFAIILTVMEEDTK